MTFKSAVGIFYYGVIVFVFVITGLAFIPAIGHIGIAQLVSFLITALFGCGLPVWLLYTTEYTVTKRDLKIRCGPFRWSIDRTGIRSITPTRNPVTSPALSLNRLEIRYGKRGVVLVSPQDRKGFYEALGFTPPPDI